MIICPSCKNVVGKRVPKSGLCPKCKQKLPDSEARTEVHLAATMDLSAIAPEPEPKPSTHHESRDPLAATILPESGRKEPSITIAPRKLSMDKIQDITNEWRGALAPDSTPRTSLKFGSKTASGMGSSLVVNPRGVRSVEGRTTNTAGADYELLEVIGKGGMGVVYAARQASVDRMVAVKMIRPNAAANAERREKFLSEAVVTGDLDHPNIVPIYELGTNEENALFYSMKRVQGTPWSDVIDSKSLLDNLDILNKVADAVAFAHANGVIHRDLKPENVMLGDYGEVLVMDWGLALATEGFRHSEFVTTPDSMGGTPAYMAPEMVTGPFELIGASSDIYLLGAILYEVATGLRPHHGETAQECLLAAARNEIQWSDQTGELIDIAFRAMATDPADRFATVLDFQAALRDYHAHNESISLATRAEQELASAVKSGDYQSYARSVFGFEESLVLWDGNTRAGQGVAQARLAYAESARQKGDYELGLSLLDAKNPDHAGLRGGLESAQRELRARQKWLARFKRIAAVLVLSILGVITAALVFVAQAKNQETAAKEQAILDRDSAKRSQAAALLAEEEAQGARRQEELRKNEALAARELAEEQRIRAVAAQQLAVEKEAEARTAEAAAVAAQEDERKQRMIAVAAKQSERYSAYLARIGMAAAKIDENAFDSAEALLAACEPEEGEEDLRDWEWGYLKRLCHAGVRFTAPGTTSAVAFAPDGSWFVTAGDDGQARRWDPQTGVQRAPIEHGRWIRSVVVSSDGRKIATAGDDGVVRLANTEGESIGTYQGHTGPVLGLAFSPRDGRWLASCSRDRSIRIWDTTTGREIANSPLRGHNWHVVSVAFSPDGSRLVSAGEDGKAIVWAIDSLNGQPRVRQDKVFLGHEGPVFAAAFSPDGKSIVSGGYDKRVLVWDPSALQDVNLEQLVTRQAIAPQSSRSLEGHSAPVRSVAFSADGQYIVSGGDDNAVRIWDVVTGKQRAALRGHSRPVQSCAFSPDGRHVVSGGQEGEIKLWNIFDYKEIRAPEGRILEGHEDAILDVAFSRDGKQIVTAGRDHTAGVYDADDGETLMSLKEGHEFLATRAVYFGDGQWLLTSGGDNNTCVWDATTGAQICNMERTGRNAAAAVSSDGQWILTGKAPQTSDNAMANDQRSQLVLWQLDIANRAVRQREMNNTRFGFGHRGNVTVVAMSPDARLLFSGDDTGAGRLWDAQTGAEIATLKGHTGSITDAAFLPGGRRLLTSSIDGTVAQWDVTNGRELPQSLVHSNLAHRDAYDTPVMAMAVSPDGRQVLTMCEDVERGARISIIRLWDVERARVVREVYRSHEDITSIALADSGRAAIAVCAPLEDSAGTFVRRWDLASGQQTAGIGGGPYLSFPPREAMWSAVESPDGGVLAVGGKGATQWNPQNPLSPLMSFKPHGGVTTAAFSPDGRWIATGSTDHRVKIWSATAGRVDFLLPVEHTKSITSVEFSPVDENLLLSASTDGTARLWDLSARRAVGVFRHPGEASMPIHQAIFLPDGRSVLTASDDATVGVWDVATGKRLATLALDSPVLSVAASADGRQILCGAANGHAILFDVETGQELALYQGHTGAINSVAFSPDGRRALTGSTDRTAKVWDAVAATTPAAVDPFEAEVSDGPDDFAPRQGKEILTLKHHDQAVTAVAFSPNGHSIVTAGLDGTAVLWMADGWEE